MGRIRTVKPETFSHERLFDAEQEFGLPLRLAWIGLWTECDRDGRFAWRPRMLKSRILPYDDIDFSRVLDALATRGFVVKYACNGEEFGFIPSWRKHQVINNREAASTIPEPTENTIESDACPTRASRVSETPVHAQAEGKGREGKGKEDTDCSLRSQSAPPNEIHSDPFRPSPQPAAPPKDDDVPLGNEGRFWAMAGEAEVKGIPRSHLGKLANLLNGDFETAVGALSDAIGAREPRRYFSKIIANLRAETADPDPNTHRRPDDPKRVPAWVIERREMGAEIRWKPPPPGKTQGRWCWGNEEYADSDDEELVAA